MSSLLEINDVLFAAVGLTSQKSSQQASQFILDWISSWDFINEVNLYEVYGNMQTDRGNCTISRQFSNQLLKQRLIAHEAEVLLDDIQDNKPTMRVLENNKIRLLFPVKSRTGPLRIIAIECTEHRPEQRVLCMHMISLFTNQIDILDEKERDQLTELMNRHTFDQSFSLISKAINHSEKKAFLALLDIDHFKKVNDTYGHLYGDEVLLNLAQIMRRNFRYNDFLYRFGGEEFIVLLYDLNYNGAISSLQRFKQEVEAFNFPAVGNITVSVGFVEILSEIIPSQAFDHADRALYYAKNHGRNQIVFYPDIADTFNEEDADSQKAKNENDIELF